MHASRFYRPGDIRFEEIPTPRLPVGGAILRVIATGLCGTDKRIYAHGHFHIPEGDPRVLGHEVIAEIVALDAVNSGLHLGDRVTLAPNFGCGQCIECKKGYTQLCSQYDAFGISVDGGFAEYIAVPEIALLQGNILTVPADFSVDEGALIEIAACSYRGLSACLPQPGESVLIIGGGTVTYLMCAWARLIGLKKVMVSVISDEWGKLSERGNPDLIINSRKQDLKTALFAATDGRGADVVIVACSAQDMDELAPDLAAIQGRVNFFGGLPSQNALVTINSRAIHYREVTITGTTGANVLWMKKTIHALKDHPFSLNNAITHHYPLSQIKTALDDADLSPRLKTIISIE